MSIQSTILCVEKEMNLNANVFFGAPQKTIAWKTNQFLNSGFL